VPWTARRLALEKAVAASGSPWRSRITPDRARRYSPAAQASLVPALQQLDHQAGEPSRHRDQQHRDPELDLLAPRVAQLKRGLAEWNDAERRDGEAEVTDDG
jgi:hypothetical protein